MAALETLREAGRDAPRSPGGHSQLLPDEGAAGSGRSRERKHQVTATTRSRLQESALSAPEGAADGGNQDGIHYSPESSLKCPFHQILAQNRIFLPTLTKTNPVFSAPGRFLNRPTRGK